MAVITITGPTCGGKTTIEAELQKLGFGRAVSHTTRAPRAAEVDGVHYHFVTDEEYNRLDDAGHFIETVHFSGVKYAMSAGSLRSAQRVSENVVIVVEPHGAAQIHAFCAGENLPSFAVWIDCPPERQAGRWVVRLTEDIAAGKSSVPYAVRLASMLTDEAQWRRRRTYTNMIVEEDCTKEYDMSLSSVLDPKYLASQVVRYVRERSTPTLL